jgi:hypothetical protein
VSTPTRRYDRDFPPAWAYGPRPRTPDESRLIPVTWAGLPLNIGDLPDGSCTVIENVEGWLDSPPLEGNDAARSIADGSAWGPKTLGARLITLTGAATGPREYLGWLRDQLAARASSREPAELAITDSGVARTLTAEVRGGSERFRHTWITPSALRWQVTLTAADPLLYEGTWQTATLIGEAAEDTGRDYPRPHPWQYAAPYIGNSALLANAGNWDAPVFALYTGDLSESRLTAEGGLIRLAPLAAGMEIRVATATLQAEAAGGLSRASYILPGSVPLVIPPAATARWFLYAAGRGTVQLAWRSAWV